MFVFGWTSVATGQVVVNEIMYDPNPPAHSTNGEWFEVYNAGSAQVNLKDWTFSDGATNPNTFTVSGDLFIGAGGYLVLGRNSDTNANGGVAVDYQYPSSFALANTDDEVIMVDGGSVEQDRVEYDERNAWPVGDGASIALKATMNYATFNNNSAANWCVSSTAYGTGALGTPGAANDCDGGGGGGAVMAEIFQIQGNGGASPEVGKLATTENNIVTAVGAGGFFIQTPTASSDNDADTSDGIFVLYDGTLMIEVGDQVDVTGTVEEFFGFTRLDATVDDASVTVDASNQPLPAPVEFGASRPSPDPANPSCAMEYECYEGMRIRIATGTVSGPSQYFNSDPVAEMHITPTGSRAFREKGLEYPGDPMHPSVPVWDGNPEVFELDPDKLGLANQSWVPGTTFSATGVLGYEFSGYELWATELSVIASAPPLPHPVRARASNEVAVASLNMLNFDRDAASYGTKRDKLSQYILEVLRAPDIIGVQEVYSLAALEGLALEIRRDDPNVRYAAYLEVGNRDPGINVGFLVRSGITVQAVTQHGKTETYLNPSTNMQDLLHDRPPLRLDASVGSVEFSVIVVHNRSLISVNTERVQAKRLAQAQSVARLAQSLQDRKLIILGDFNAFQFTDGYVDVIGQITGNVTASENVSSGPDLVDPDLTNLIERVPAPQRYSYSFRNNAQVLDHALVNERMLPAVVGMQYARGNVDAAGREENNIDSPLRTSDHDGFVVWLSAPGRSDGGGGGGGGNGGGLPPGDGEADLGLSVAGPFVADGRARFTVTVRNAGPGSARGVLVSSALSGTGNAAGASTSGCEEDPDGLARCTLGDLAADGSASFTIDVPSAGAGGPSLGYTGAVKSDTPDPRPGNDTVTATLPLGPPAAPTDLVATPRSGTEIELRWKDNSSTETGFAVYQQGPGDSKLRLVGTAPANSMSTVVRDLVPNVTYRFAVESRNGALRSERTPKATATTWTVETAHCGEGDYLCLGRFQVEVDWEDAEGRTGRGTAERLTALSGDFWFFDPANIELVVKVLDGCSINGHYWVYAVGLTDVAVRMTVRDLHAGSPFAGVATSMAEKTWTTALGDRFDPISDLEAFATCGPLPAASAAAGYGRNVLSGAPLGAFDRRRAGGGHGSGSRGGPDRLRSLAAAAACTGDDGSLCLQNGRYDVRANWRVGEETGAATGVPRTVDTGMFWFFSPDNVELVVKVLDGCALNGHRWVLMGGLTDVGVEVVVRDAMSDTEAKAYRSPEGSPFATMFDVTAFPCVAGR